VLTSVHGAKGREADLVVLLPDLTRSTARGLQRTAAGREAENRVFYVAATRAREDLVIVAPRGRRHYVFPSFRFEEGRL
jgi:superfamily I DNA/RNA helicase